MGMDTKPADVGDAQGGERPAVSWEDHLRARHDERRPGLYPMRIRPYLGRSLAGDRFFTDAYLGRGAFGCVFRGRQTSLQGRPVAIKLLIPPAARESDSGLAAQFERAAYYFDREATILAKLNHPCIVQIYDSGVEDGVVWIAMEFAAGASLAELLDDANEVWTWSRILRVSSGVLAGLAAAHQLQVIHRDLKPANIMITNPVGYRDAAKLLDFGVAKLFRLLHDRRVQTVIGTPEYMAPEQWNGNSADHRTDIYALGVILYQMVSGGLPYCAPDVRELAQQHRHGRVPPPQPRVGLMRIAAVDDIIYRAMSKAATDRFPDALTMLAALQRAVTEGVPDAADLLPDVDAAGVLPAGEPLAAPRVPNAAADRTMMGYAVPQPPPARPVGAGAPARDTMVDLVPAFVDDPGTRWETGGHPHGAAMAAAQLRSS